MKTSFLNEIIEIIENQIIEQILRLLNRTGQKSKLLNELTIIESKTSYWKNMPLLHKHSSIGHKTETFEWKKNDIGMKLLKELNIKMKILTENKII